jgi:hypothetical protein
MLNIPSFTKRLEAPAPPPHMDPNGGALSGYTGHCPRQASPPANYRRTIRAQPPLAAKVGSTPQQHWLPRSRSAITPPPSWRDTVKGAGGAAGKLDEFLAKSISMKGIVTNDWRAHQPEEPPSLPQSSRSYRRAVGGIMVGWSGSVPHSAAHFGSNPVGTREHSASARSISTAEQRGHVGKTAGGKLFRRHDDNATSSTAANAVVGYTGHLPSALHAFGVSAWASPTQQVADDAVAYSA